MGQSIMQNYLHISFSTKHRQPLITENIEEELYKYIGGTCNSFECHPIKIGAHFDHIHILCMLSKKVMSMKLIEVIKSSSSKWIKTKGDEFSNFYWQDGYGGFSVNPSEIDVVTNYIANQKEHHKKMTFQEEYRAFLKKYKVAYDERYIWD